jgi:inosose dehydratase
MKLANAPCSWGILEFGLEGETADCRRFLTELKEANYTGTELGDWGFMPTSADELGALLSEFDLPLLGAFVPVDFADPDAHDAGIEVATRTAALMAPVNPDAFIVLADDNGKHPVRTANAGRIGPEHALDDALWPTFAVGVERVARAVRHETGLRSVFHHHCAGWVETPEEVGQLMDRVDRDLVGLCFDTGHWMFGGGDPVAGLKRWIDRVWHVHFKDCEPAVAERAREESWDYFESVRQGVFCELGEGAVDFRGVLQALEESDYDDWIVVEQDVLPGMGAPLESAKRNRSYLESIGL